MKNQLLRLGVPARLVRAMPRAPQAGPAAGIVWMLAGAFGVTLIGVFVKTLGKDLHPVQIAGVRAVMIVAVMAAFMLPKGRSMFRVRRRGLLSVRAVLLVYINAVGFWTLSVLPLFFVTAISFTKPMFITLLAAIALGETVRLRRTMAMVAGFAGVLIALVPQWHGGAESAIPLLPVLAALGVTLAMAVSMVLIKHIAEVDTAQAIVFWPNLAVAAILGLASILVWAPPSPTQWILLLGLAAAGYGAQQSFLRAYRHAEAGVVAPFEYTRIPLAAVAGIALFGEIPTIWTVTGALTIALSALYIARREAKVGKATDANTPPEARDTT